METHLPFWPPGQFVDRFAPYFREIKEARAIMRNWNREAYRWAAPLPDPLGELESKVLHDMYDAEVAYQDDYLNELFSVIDARANNANTLTIIVSDHGDGLGEHGYMGHAFVAYQELVHVPLIINWPDHGPKTGRVETPISTRRVFHTMVNASGHGQEHADSDVIEEARHLSLEASVIGPDPEEGTAISEIYPPLNFVKAIEQRQPHLLEQFRCLSERRAIVKSGKMNTHKLIRVDRKPDQLFDLAYDPLELQNVREDRLSLAEESGYSTYSEGGPINTTTANSNHRTRCQS